MSFQSDTSFASGQLRIAVFSVAFFDLAATLSREWRVYRDPKASATKMFLLIFARYLGVIALVANGIMYFGSWSESTCKRIHLLPGIIQLLAGAAAQAVMFHRVVVISKKGKNVIGIMAFSVLAAVPLETVAVVFNRDPINYVNPMTQKNGCASIVPEGRFNAGPLFYLAHLGFDIFVVVLSSYQLFNKSDPRAVFKSLFYNGIVFVFLDGLVQTATFLASVGVTGIQHIGSIFAILSSLLVAQHIIFITHRRKEPVEHDTVLLPSTIYHSRSTTATGFGSTRSLPAFAPAKRAETMPIPSNNYSCASLHTAKGREALRYRDEGDVDLYRREPMPSMGVVTKEVNAERPVSVDMRPISTYSMTGMPVYGQAM